MYTSTIKIRFAFIYYVYLILNSDMSSLDYPLLSMPLYTLGPRNSIISSALSSNTIKSLYDSIILILLLSSPSIPRNRRSSTKVKSAPT